MERQQYQPPERFEKELYFGDLNVNFDHKKLLFRRVTQGVVCGKEISVLDYFAQCIGRFKRRQWHQIIFFLSRYPFFGGGGTNLQYVWLASLLKNWRPLMGNL